MLLRSGYSTEIHLRVEPDVSGRQLKPGDLNCLAPQHLLYYNMIHQSKDFGREMGLYFQPMYMNLWTWVHTTLDLLNPDTNTHSTESIQSIVISVNNFHRQVNNQRGDRRSRNRGRSRTSNGRIWSQHLKPQLNELHRASQIDSLPTQWKKQNKVLKCLKIFLFHMSYLSS